MANTEYSTTGAESIVIDETRDRDGSILANLNSSFSCFLLSSFDDVDLFSAAAEVDGFVDSESLPLVSSES